MARMPDPEDHLPPGALARENAARLLVTPSALGELSMEEAAQIVNYMEPVRIPAGTVFIQEGESADTHFMLLVLEGDVSAESEISALHDSMVVSVLGPGSLIGEMGLIDGAPRSATCTAATDISGAMLSRTGLVQLVRERPAVAASLVIAISKRMADRLRETNRKLRSYTQLNKALQQELDATHGVNRRLLEQMDKLQAAKR